MTVSALDTRGKCLWIQEQVFTSYRTNDLYLTYRKVEVESS